MSSVFSVKNFDKCISCAACESICPKNAIELKCDELGFKKPNLINECIDCGLCTKVCSMFQDFANQSCIAMKCYSANSNDQSILANSSSGGVSYHLMKELVAKGFTVIGCTYDISSNKAYHLASSSIDDLEKYFGSKYFQSDFKNAVQYLINHKKEKIAIFGLPCQIKSIRLVSNFYKINHENLFLVSVMCYGVSSPVVWEKYINEIVSKKIKGKITNVKFRSKYYGWHRSTIEFWTSDYKYITNPLENEFLELFYSRCFFNESCYECSARKEFSSEDLRIGDFWGDKFQKNETGKSGIIVCTTFGEAILSSIKSSLELKEEAIESFLSNQSLSNVENSPKELRKELHDILITKGIKKTVKIYRKKHLGLKQRIFQTIWILKRRIINHEKKFKKNKI